jgi:hypothetical protein
MEGSSELDFDPPVPRPPDRYTVVKKAHIVPKIYLNAFANEQEQIQVVLVNGGRTFRNATRNVGIRKEFYGRTRPDGSRIFDAEWSLSVLEGATAGLLSDLGDKWPLELAEKATLAQFFALQLVRGPRHAAWRAEELRRTGRQVKRAAASGIWQGRPPTREQITATTTHLLSDSQRLLDMELLATKVSSVLGSMTWALVEFDRPLLSLGDHPVSIWPIGRDSRRPRPTPLQSVGLRNIFEARAPVSPTLALLMFWGDRPDLSEVLAGEKRHAKSLNSFTVAEADVEWFYRPGSPRPPASLSRAWRSLSSDLVPAYSHQGAVNSEVRVVVAEKLQSDIGKGVEALDQHGRGICEMVVVEESNEVRQVPIESEGGKVRSDKPPVPDSRV